MKELSPYAEFHNKWRGYATYYNDKEVPKGFAFHLLKQGHKIAMKEKPGWMDGILIDVKQFNEYLKENVLY